MGSVSDRRASGRGGGASAFTEGGGGTGGDFRHLIVTCVVIMMWATDALDIDVQWSRPHQRRISSRIELVIE